MAYYDGARERRIQNRIREILEEKHRDGSYVGRGYAGGAKQPCYTNPWVTFWGEYSKNVSKDGGKPSMKEAGIEYRALKSEKKGKKLTNRAVIAAAKAAAKKVKKKKEPAKKKKAAAKKKAPAKKKGEALEMRSRRGRAFSGARMYSDYHWL